MNRRGMALPLVLLTLLVVLGTASLLLERALLLRRAGERQVQAFLAVSAASGSVAFRVVNWDPTAVASLAVGGAGEMGTRTSGRRLQLVDSVVRLGPALFLLSSTALGGTGHAAGRRRVGQLVHTDSGGEAASVAGGWSILGQ